MMRFSISASIFREGLVRLHSAEPAQLLFQFGETPVSLGNLPHLFGNLLRFFVDIGNGASFWIKDP